MVSARAASTARVTGLTSANHCTAPGIEEVGTNADEAKVSGKTQMNPTDWAASGSRTVSPTKALIHEKTYEKPSTSAKASARS
jgi:hypothetical protein